MLRFVQFHFTMSKSAGKKQPKEQISAESQPETVSEPTKHGIDYSNAVDGTKVISLDPWLEPYAQTLRDRCAREFTYFSD
jgi:hypothetical protein